MEGAEQACEQLEQALALTQETDELQVLLSAESRGAAAYWGAWAELPMRFGRRDTVG